MAHSSECRDRYAQKVLDTADIVRQAIFRQLGTIRRARMPQVGFGERDLFATWRPSAASPKVGRSAHGPEGMVLTAWTHRASASRFTDADRLHADGSCDARVRVAQTASTARRRSSRTW